MPLKRRIVLIFAAGIGVPDLSIATVSYLAISSIMIAKTKVGIQDSLGQTLLVLENTIRNLGYVSEQPTLDGAVGILVKRYLETPSLYERSRLKLETRNELNLLSFTNPNVGLIRYYFASGDGSRDLESTPAGAGFGLAKGYYWFKATGGQGWSVVSLVPPPDRRHPHRSSTSSSTASRP